MERLPANTPLSGFSTSELQNMWDKADERGIWSDGFSPAEISAELARRNDPIKMRRLEVWKALVQQGDTPKMVNRFVIGALNRIQGTQDGSGFERVFWKDSDGKEGYMDLNGDDLRGFINSRREVAGRGRKLGKKS